METIPAVTPPPPTSRTARAVMRGNRGRDTSPELALRSALHRRGLRFRVHRRPLAGMRHEVDILFPRPRLAVQVDGCFWHSCPVHGSVPSSNRAYWEAKLRRNVERDREFDARLRDAGWLVLRLWEHEPVEQALERVIRALELRGWPLPSTALINPT